MIYELNETMSMIYAFIEPSSVPFFFMEGSSFGNDQNISLIMDG